MRLIIAAGLIMGMALGVQSAHDAHVKATVSQAASTVRIHVSAPWYIAMNAWRGANTAAGVSSRS
jgi:hypothetical protein